MELKHQLTDRIESVQKKLREANFECNRIRELIDSSFPVQASKPQSVTPPVIPPPVVSSAPPRTQDVPITPPSIQAKTPDPVTPPAGETPRTEVPVTQPVVDAPATRVAPPVAASPAALPTAEKQQRTHLPPVVPPKAPVAKRDLEDFIGGNLLNKIGIGILILGIGIFVKYAIDQDWIGPIGRVMVGLLSGGILLGVAHYLRTQYKSFSSVLVGGGIAVLYFSVAIAFHQYQLLPQVAAFALMCVVTGAAVVLSIGYNRQEIAILAVLGGFATPFMVAKGDGNYAALFSYLLVLNVGMMSLSAFRAWPAVRILSFVTTVLLFGGWMTLNFNHPTQPPVLAGALAFAIAFFVVFFAMNLVFHVRAKAALGLTEYILVLANSAFFFGMGMWVLYYLGDGAYLGLFTALMGAFHFAFLFPVRKLIRVDNNVAYLLIGMVLSFLTLAVPIQLRGDYLAIFWSVEAVLVLFLAQRTRLKVLLTGSHLITVFALVGLMIDWSAHYFLGTQAGARTLFFNTDFLSTLIAVGGLVGQHLLYRSDADDKQNSMGGATLTSLALLPIGYIGLTLELWTQFSRTSYETGHVAVLTGTFLYLTAMQLLAWKSRMSLLSSVLAVVQVLALAGYVFCHYFVLDDSRAMHGGLIGTHYLMLPGLLLSTVLVFVGLRKQVGLRTGAGNALVLATTAFAVFFASAELDNLCALGGLDLHQVHRTGYPILWGLMGAGLIVLGLQQRVVALRRAGLLLFALLLVKLFAFDIQEANTAGKIAAFISLGVLLLVVSFLYQKLKLLLKEDSQEAANQDQHNHPA
jgi:uncharacterized membrane protein